MRKVPVLDMICATCSAIHDVYARCPRCALPLGWWLCLALLVGLLLGFGLLLTGCGMTYYKDSAFYQSLTPFQQWQYDQEVQRSLRETSNALLDASRPAPPPVLPAPRYPVTCQQYPGGVHCY